MNTDSESKLPNLNRFSTEINGRTFQFEDPVPDARQFLNAANFLPADECILIQVFAHGARAIGLDETVDLRAPGIESFWAFKADRVYRFTVDERGFDWGEARIKEPMLRLIAHVGNDEVIVLDRGDQADQEIGSEDEVRLADAGTEHLHIEKRIVTVFFKDEPFQIQRGIYTTEALISRFPIETGYLLNLKTNDGELLTLKPGQEIRIKEGMHFYSQVPGGGSS